MPSQHAPISGLDPQLLTESDMVVYTCNLSTGETEAEGSEVQDNLWIMYRVRSLARLLTYETLKTKTNKQETINSAVSCFGDYAIQLLVAVLTRLRFSTCNVEGLDLLIVL